MSGYKNIGLLLSEKYSQEKERIALHDSLGKDDMVCEADKFFLLPNNKSFFDQMKKGYTEMGSINLALAWDNRCVEAEAFNFCTYLKGKGE